MPTEAKKQPELCACGCGPAQFCVRLQNGEPMYVCWECFLRAEHGKIEQAGSGQ